MNIANSLLIYGNTNQAQNFEWLKIIDKFSENETQSNTLLEIAQYNKLRDIIVILPGTDTTTTSITLPTSRFSQLQTAIPYALEDRLTSDVQQLYFAFHQEGKTKTYAVAITDKKQLNSWLEEFNKANLKPIKMVPEYLALPFKDDEWTVVISDKYSLVRTGANKGYTIEQNHLFNLLAQQYNEESKVKPREIYLINLTQKEFILPEELTIPKGIIRIETRDTSLCQIFREGLINAPTDINLLPKEFHFGHSLKKINKFWLLAGSLTLLWLSVFIIGNSLSYFYLLQKKDRLQQQVTLLYQQLFPEATTIVAPKLRIQQEIQKIQQQQSDRGLLTLLKKAGAVLKTSSNIQFEQLSYQNNSLNLIINVPDIKQWQIIQNKLENDGLKVKQVNIKPDKNSFSVSFIIA